MSSCYAEQQRRSDTHVELNLGLQVIKDVGQAILEEEVLAPLVGGGEDAEQLRDDSSVLEVCLHTVSYTHGVKEPYAHSHGIMDSLSAQTEFESI